jgi:hypothetical protein
MKLKLDFNDIDAIPYVLLGMLVIPLLVMV